MGGGVVTNDGSGASYDKHYMANFALFFALGMLNYFLYTTVLSAAKKLADDFNATNQLPLIPWANIAAGFVVRPLNILLERVPILLRIFLNATFMLVGPLMIAFAAVIGNFNVALISIVVVGASLSFGESILLAHVRHFTPQSVAGYSSGTGLAGVAASLFFLILTFLDVPLVVTFVCMSTLSVPFVICFLLLRKPDSMAQHPELADDDREAALIGVSGSGTGSLGQSIAHTRRNSDTPMQMTHHVSAFDEYDEIKGDEYLLGEVDHIGEREMEGLLDLEADGHFEETTALKAEDISAKLARLGVQGSLKLFFHNIGVFFGRVAKAAWVCRRYELQIMLVYFFEYGVSVGNAAKAEPLYDPHAEEDYIALQFAYQFGVLISRSSLSFFKFKCIEVLTFLQFLNFLIWNAQDYFKFKYFTMWVQFPSMLFVGLLGGCIYVNTFYLVMHSTSIPKDLKEICVTLITLTMTVGISGSCLWTLIADHTWLADK
ncbi:Batten's disease protein Cln3 [Carpediemonas membranifera]|uniref:Batten's disease protein Cln3 n=1 Tax=Carpediemonas membranifera TaxID=201153 RepID=A0A8J6B6M2_9EUKA|nr:Batten's disease protein Cln3 [Carpediemonas membranifera]|eukprot:KAG9393917.1 Batten's disease protein Cln3 [Carpediemonas membranifera]